MLKFLKMMVAEDVIITEEAQVEVLVAEEVQLQEEKEALLQDVKVVADRSDSSAPREGGFGPRSSSAPREKVVLHQTDQQKVHLIEHQDVQKTLVTHQDQEDQEETNV
jgi:hypothetical protein